jgi:hypothetical protein
VKYIGLLFVASLFVNIAVANTTQLALTDNLDIRFDKGRSQHIERNSRYNYSTTVRSESIGLIQKFQLSPRISAGLGLWLGGLDIELETEASVVQFDEISVDLNRWLGVRAKINFADIIPFGNIAYLYESRNQQLRFNADVGIKFIKPSNVSLAFNGEWGEIVEQRNDLISQLQRDALSQLKEYYLEPLLGLDLSYTFN